MPEELITPENLTTELIREVFETALMDWSYDDEGDIKVKEQVNCFVLPEEERKDRIRLLTLFRFKKEASMQQRYECVNNINREYIVVRAVVGKNEMLLFNYDILVAGGITKRALVLAVKRFCSIPRNALEDFGADLVE
ncbi:MAG: YbjN domain-containing protein [bacterium]